MLWKLGTLFTILILNTYVLGFPYVGFPISQQLPEVGRIGESYKFALNSQTFKSDSGEQIVYDAFNLPNWLKFDANTLVLTGSPTDKEQEGTIEFVLQGTDSQGSLNQTGEIYLSSSESPYINTDMTIIEQLENMGYTNGYNGIVLKPDEDFSFKFDSNSFELPANSASNQLIYYGKSSNRTSLPSWVYFDSNTLTFYGTAPTVNSQNAPSLQYDLTLIATDYSGFTGVYQDFNIVVGGHYLVLNSTDYEKTFNGSTGSDIDIEIPLKDIVLDGSIISSDDIDRVIINNSPDWIKVEDNRVIKGTIPDDETNNIILNVTLFDIYGDTLYLDFQIDIVHDLFTGDLPNVNVTRDSYLAYELPEDEFYNLTAITINPIFDSDWLRFYHANNSFVGKAPADFNSLEVEIEAAYGILTQSKNFTFIGVGRVSSSSSHFPSSSTRAVSSRVTSSASVSVAGMITSSPTRTSSSTPSSTSAISGTNSTKEKSSNTKALAIGLGVGIPVFLILVILAFLSCCGVIPIFNRRRQSSEEGDEENPEDSFETQEDDSIEKGSHFEQLDNESSLYELPVVASTDQLLAEPSGIYNSWRGSTRDSLNSLATVATNDLLTVNVVETNKARRSQLNLFKENTNQLGVLTTLNEEGGDAQWKEFANKGSLSRNDVDEKSEHSQSGSIVEDD